MSPLAAPAPLNLLFGLRAHAALRARHLAVVDEFGAFTFGEVWDAATRFAGRLRAAGVRPGGVVGVAMEGSAAYPVTVLGALLAGGVAAPLNILLTRPELARYLAVIGPAVVAADLPSAELLPEGTPVLEVGALAPGRTLVERLGGPATAECSPVTVGLRRPTAAAALLFPTGGTSGLPKAAILSHRAVYLWAMSVAGHGNAGRGIELFSLQCFHVGLLTGPLSTLHAGGEVIVQGRFDPERAVEWIIADGANRIQTAPTLLRKLASAAGFDKARHGVEYLRFGGMASGPEFVDELLDAFPQALISTSYGATEFGPVTRAGSEDYRQGRREGVGRPVPGVQLTIVGDHGDTVAAGEPGDIVVRCAWQASGYMGRPGETAATFTEAGVRLADCGVVHDDGWLTLLGRRSDMIITGGENVFPTEVEAVLATHPGVTDVVVIGVPDPTWGERVEAVVVAAPDAEPTLDELRDFTRVHLARYKLPRSVRLVETIPLTANNKPDRRALAAAAR